MADRPPDSSVLDAGDAYERERAARYCEQMRSEDDQRRHEDMEIHARTAYLRMRLGDFYIRSGKVERAIAEYRRAVKMDGNNAVFRTRLGDTFVLKDMVQQAMTQYRHAIRSDPGLADPRISLGDLYRRFGMNVQALEQYQIAVDLDPTRAYYRFKLADALAAAGKTPEALHEYQALVNLAPGDAFYQFRYGDLFLRLGRAREAVACFAQAARLAPYDGYYLVRYGVLALALGRIVEAVDALRSALKMDPRNRCYRVLLADAYAEAGLEDDAADLLTQVGELDSYELEFVGRRRLELNRAEMDAGAGMNVLALTQGALGTNCYLVWSETSRQAVLVDCAGDASALLAEAEVRGLTICLVLLTHGHIDHIDAVGNLLRGASARVAIHALDAALLGDPMLSGAALFGFSQQAVTPSLLLHEGESVSPDGTDLSLQVLHTPGHTPGSICLLGEDALFSGDTLFADGIGRTDLPGGDEARMRDSLSRLVDLPDDLVVYPGHGPATTLAEERRHNPWLRGW